MQAILYYSTISGNTRLVGEALQGIFANAGITLTLQDVAEDTTWQDEVDFFLIGCGTYGHGQLQNLMRQCVEKEWKDKRLNNLSGVAVGLGDHRYDREYNIYAADMLESWIQEHGGNLICPALKINRSPIKTNNQKIIENWAKNFITSLRK
jgi:flavodoxin